MKTKTSLLLFACMLATANLFAQTQTFPSDVKITGKLGIGDDAFDYVSLRLYQHGVGGSFQYGIHSEQINSDPGICLYGAYFNNTNVDSYDEEYGANVYGVYVLNNQRMKEFMYGGYFRNQQFHTTSTAPIYGLYSSSNRSSPNSPMYGIYSEVTGVSGSAKKWAGYFTGGDMYFSHNVGIGTTNPTVKLDVAGAAKVEKITATGNIGIGADNNSAALLHIASQNHMDAAILASAADNNRLIVSSVQSEPINSISFRLRHEFQGMQDNGYINFYRGASRRGGFLTFGTDGQERLRVDTDGNVLIGTATISNYGTWARVVDVYNPASSKLLVRNSAIKTGVFSKDGWNGTAGRIGTESPHDLRLIAGNNDFMTITTNGNVGIGTANPTATLDVAGTIRAHEVKVCLNQGCDYVFEEDYKLMDLSELSDFVKTNKHLPDVAPAAQMEAEGIDVSEMNALLLRKVEELTLYVIELKDEIETLKKQED
jgi:hypothetical protein